MDSVDDRNGKGFKGQTLTNQESWAVPRLKGFTQERLKLRVNRALKALSASGSDNLSPIQSHLDLLPAPAAISSADAMEFGSVGDFLGVFMSAEKDCDEGVPVNGNSDLNTPWYWPAGGDVTEASELAATGKPSFPAVDQDLSMASPCPSKSHAPCPRIPWHLLRCSNVLCD